MATAISLKFEYFSITLSIACSKIINHPFRKKFNEMPIYLKIVDCELVVKSTKLLNENFFSESMEITKEIKNEPYAVRFEIQDQGKKVAWAYLYVIFQDRHDEPYGLMENVYVESEYRRKGLGTKLVQAVINEAKERNCYKLISTSRNSNLKVHHWYQKLGLVEYGKEFRMDFLDSKPKQKD